MRHKLARQVPMPFSTIEPRPLRVLERQAFHPWLVVGVTCIGAFVGQLDASIVQLALPALTHAFNATVNEVRWVAIAYLVAFAGSLGVFGRVCDMLDGFLVSRMGLPTISARAAPQGGVRPSWSARRGLCA